MLQMVCAHCQLPFQRSSRRTKRKRNSKHYCSLQCSLLAKLRYGPAHQNWKGGDSEKTCQHCGRLFKRQRSIAHLAKFCSYKCATAEDAWTKEEAEALLDEMKASSFNVTRFAENKAMSVTSLRAAVYRFFPDEWDSFIESRWPRTSLYVLGRAFEYKVRDLFREHGYWVMRSPQSRSPVDLVAIRTGEVVMIQCKRGVAKSLSRKDKKVLFELASSVEAVALLAFRPTPRTIGLLQLPDMAEWNFQEELNNAKEVESEVESQATTETEVLAGDGTQGNS